jgi:type IV pilus assembly protein PilE
MTARSRIRSYGFTLVELAIVVAVIALLATIALPSYFSQVQKSKRTEGRAALLAAASQMERYYTERSTFASATLGSTGVYPNVTEHGYYTLALTNLGASTFTLNATPAGSNAGDVCGTLTYTQQGVKGFTGSADPSLCW